MAPDLTVFDGLKRLADYGVGAVLVMDSNKLVGIFSERDYTRKVALQGKNSRAITIADIMTSAVISAGVQMRLSERARREISMRLRPACL